MAEVAVAALMALAVIALALVGLGALAIVAFVRRTRSAVDDRGDKPVIVGHR